MGDTKTEATSSGCPKYAPTFENLREYFSLRTPLSVCAGGLTGVTAGFYAGDMVALYGYTYALGFGIFSTSYFLGTFSLRYVRNKDDYVNHAASGFVSAGLMVRQRMTCTS